MYSLSEFVPYVAQKLTGETIVLSWSKEEGYRFCQVGFLFHEKIIAVRG